MELVAIGLPAFIDWKQLTFYIGPMEIRQMYQVSRLDPQERQREKQISRDRDCVALRVGAVSQSELAVQNGMFSALDISGAQIARRGRIAG